MPNKPEPKTYAELSSQLLSDKAFKTQLKNNNVDWAIQDKPSPYLGELSEYETNNKAERALLLYYLLRVQNLIELDQFQNWYDSFAATYYSPFFKPTPNEIKNKIKLDLGAMFSRLFLQFDDFSLTEQGWDAYNLSYLAGLTRLLNENHPKNAVKSRYKNKTDFLQESLDLLQNDDRYFNALSKLNKAMGLKLLNTVLNKVSNKSIEDDYEETPDKVLNAIKNPLIYEYMSSAHTTRLQNTGYSVGAELIGYQEIEYSAIMDGRTTDICRSLNGTKWVIQNVVNYYMDALSFEYVSDFERKMPFSSNPEDFAYYGVKVPPRHYLCRSSLIIVEMSFRDL